MGRKYGITLYYFPETGNSLKKCLFGKSFKQSFKLQKVKFSKSSWLLGEERIQHQKANEARIDEKSLGVLISRKMTPKPTLKTSPVLLRTLQSRKCSADSRHSRYYILLSECSLSTSADQKGNNVQLQNAHQMLSTGPATCGGLWSPKIQSHLET